MILRPAISIAWKQARSSSLPNCLHIHQSRTHSSSNGLSRPAGISSALPPNSTLSEPTSIKAANQQKTDSIYTYLLDHTNEHPVLEQLRAATLDRFPQAAKMAVSPEQGAFLGWLVGTLGAKRIIELGVFTGYSSLAMALALPDDGCLIACDRDATAMAVAEEHWKQAGVSHKVTPTLGAALDALQGLLDAGEVESFDFAFVDADKRMYRQYYELLLKLVRRGGVIAIDNVLWYGKVADVEVNDKATVALRALNDFLITDERVAVNLAPIGDGIFLCRKY